MQTKEWKWQDLGPGPWESEPDKVQWQDPETSLPCLIVRAITGALCGYVGVPRGHPWYEKPYDEIESDVSVHGNLTFSDHCDPEDQQKGICHLVEEGEDDDVWWLGFDCGHVEDLLPRDNLDSLLLRILTGRLKEGRAQQPAYRDIAYVREQVRLLAQQVKAAAGELKGA